MQIPDQPYKILISRCSGSGETNLLFNLMSHHHDLDKTYLYAKDPYEAKYQPLINSPESTDFGTF